MTVMYGADADELDRLAVEFIRAADELDGEGVALSGILNRVSWLGDIATRYLDNWTGIQIPKIGLSTQFLRDAARQLQAEARDQRVTSEAGTSSAAAPPTRAWLRHGQMRLPGNPRLIAELIGFPDPLKMTEALKNGMLGYDSLLLLGSLATGGGPAPKWLAKGADWTAMRILGSKLHIFATGGKSAAINGRLGGLTTSLRNSYNMVGPTLPFKKVVKGAGLTALLGGVDVFLNHREHGSNHALTITAGIDPIISLGTSFVPGGPIVYGLTRAGGDAVMGKLDDHLDIYGQNADSYTQRRWGVNADKLTSEQAQQLNDRYKGIPGLWNSNYDVVHRAFDDYGRAGVKAMDYAADFGTKFAGVFR